MFYSVRHNGRSLTWRVEQVIPWCHPVRQLEACHEETMTVENTIMFRDFGSAQTNRTVIPGTTMGTHHFLGGQSHEWRHQLLCDRLGAHC